jgi:hypothetical protein
VQPGPQMTAKAALVVYSLFLGTHECVPNTFLGVFWPTGSYVPHGMRMTIPSMLFVLIAIPLGLHGHSCPYQDQSMFPHIVIHHILEYDDIVPWICMPGLGACRCCGIIIQMRPSQFRINAEMYTAAALCQGSKTQGKRIQRQRQCQHLATTGIGTLPQQWRRKCCHAGRQMA